MTTQITFNFKNEKRDLAFKVKKPILSHYSKLTFQESG